VVLGISTDLPAANLAFKRSAGLSFPLLCDIDREVSLLYGAVTFKQAYYADRITYIIDEHGIITRVYPKVSAATHPQELLEVL